MEGAQGGEARRGDGRVCPACGEVGEAVVEVAWDLLVGEVEVERDREDHDDEVRNEVGKAGDDEGDEAKYCRYQTEVWKGKVHDLEGQRKEGE